MRWRFAEAGVTEHVFVVKSNGGGMMLEAADNPAEKTVSGPTGGSAAGKYTARLLGPALPVTLGMRPTSTDCPTIVNGRENFTTNVEIKSDAPIQIPMTDVRTVRPGCGSAAYTGTTLREVSREF
jgi:N-methylhydantoinase A